MLMVAAWKVLLESQVGFTAFCSHIADSGRDTNMRVCHHRAEAEREGKLRLQRRKRGLLCILTAERFHKGKPKIARAQGSERTAALPQEPRCRHFRSASKMSINLRIRQKFRNLVSWPAKALWCGLFFRVIWFPFYWQVVSVNWNAPIRLRFFLERMLNNKIIANGAAAGTAVNKFREFRNNMEDCFPDPGYIKNYRIFSLKCWSRYKAVFRCEE